MASSVHKKQKDVVYSFHNYLMCNFFICSWHFVHKKKYVNLGFAMLIWGMIYWWAALTMLLTTAGYWFIFPQALHCFDKKKKCVILETICYSALNEINIVLGCFQNTCYIWICLTYQCVALSQHLYFLTCPSRVLTFSFFIWPCLGAKNIFLNFFHFLKKLVS